MSYYVILELDVHNPAPYIEHYAKVVGPIVEAAGGTYIVRAGEITNHEGDWLPGRLVILKWPDKATYETFHASEAYQRIKHHRLDNVRSRVTGVEGYDGAGPPPVRAKT